MNLTAMLRRYRKSLAISLVAVLEPPTTSKTILSGHGCSRFAMLAATADQNPTYDSYL
jgi:hypothetical protein